MPRPLRSGSSSPSGVLPHPLRLPTFTQRQLAAFCLITILGVAYASVQYVGLPRLLGADRYSVILQLPDSGGLYPNAIVTYRGKEIGKVESVDLVADGVTASLSLDDDVPVPRDAPVRVRSTSAVGEQYVDFVPRGRTGAPALVEDDVIPRGQVAVPTETAELLRAVDELVASLPRDSLRTVRDEAHTAVAGTGQDLQRLVDSGGSLLAQARADLGPTVRLLTDLQPVLATAQRRSSAIAGAAGDLASFTDRLRADDARLRRIIDTAPPLARELDALVDGARPTLPVLLDNLAGIGQVTTTYLDNLRMTLIVFPIVVQQVQSAVYGAPDPTFAKFSFKLTVNDPPACTTGFLPPELRRDPNDVRVASAAAAAYCRLPKDSPVGVRMARNHPCPPGSPAGRAATSRDARGCGLSFQSAREEAGRRAYNIAVQDCVARHNPQRRGEPFREPAPGEVCARGDAGEHPDENHDEREGALRTVPAPAPTGTAAYLPRSGTAIAPDGQPFVVGNAVAPQPSGPPGLGAFLLTPLRPPSP